MYSLSTTQPTTQPNILTAVASQSNATTVKFTKEQKETVDRAYDVFKGSSSAYATKGAFIELLARHYLSDKESTRYENPNNLTNTSM